MIYESRFWKGPLLRAATWLERVRISDDSYEKDMVKLEKELFIGFYAIRKLLDTFKVSDSTREMSFTLEWSPCIKSVDHMNSHKIDELYDLTQRKHETRDLGYLCNQFIHSFVFMPVMEDGKALSSALKGCFISSDKIRQKKLYFIGAPQILKAFRTVGKDYPTRANLRRNPVTWQWEGSVS